MKTNVNTLFENLIISTFYLLSEYNDSVKVFLNEDFGYSGLSMSILYQEKNKVDLLHIVDNLQRIINVWFDLAICILH